MTLYSPDFMKAGRLDVTNSAAVIIPILRNIMPVNSVVDLGCGDGTWLNCFSEHGVETVLGVDGQYVDRSILQISPANFTAHDLERPFRLDKTFDLVCSLETAEHLPESAASVFVESLVGLGPVILFSAGVPHQPGTQHVNCQWPDYWSSVFERYSYKMIDCIRPTIWPDTRVSRWYRQNMVLFVREDYLPTNVYMNEFWQHRRSQMVNVIHPDYYLDCMHNQASLRWLLRMLPKSLGLALRRRLMPRSVLK